MDTERTCAECGKKDVSAGWWTRGDGAVFCAACAAFIALESLERDERLEVLRGFCRGCGGEPGCQCENDE